MKLQHFQRRVYDGLIELGNKKIRAKFDND